MSYATAAELGRIVLKNRTPSSDQALALQRVLDIATLEIDAEIDLITGDTALSAAELEVAEQVCLDRAADLWHHTESQTGLTGLIGDEGGFATPGRYSWKRYADRLAPLKRNWGLA